MALSLGRFFSLSNSGKSPSDNGEQSLHLSLESILLLFSGHTLLVEYVLSGHTGERILLQRKTYRTNTCSEIWGEFYRSITLDVSHGYFINADCFSFQTRNKERFSRNEILYMIIKAATIWMMTAAEESIDLKRYLVKRSSADTLDSKILDFCQLFRLYSSIILVVVGNYLDPSSNRRC
jgi:hypothetical protein